MVRFLDKPGPPPVTSIPAWGCSSVGRAQGWQSWGQGFDSPQLHQSSRRGHGAIRDPVAVSTSPVTISVILPVYNQLALTRACLESLRGTSEPFELCVVDNASTDGTEAFFRAWPLPFPRRYQRNADNVGLIRALNQGMQLA